MDLAVVLGRGAPGLTGLAGVVPIVEPEQVALIGHRPASLGPDVAAELALVPPAVRQITAPEVRSRGAGDVAQAILETAGDGPAWLHIDVDALDAVALPAVSYPLAQGLDWDELEALLAALLAPGVCGVSVADLNSDLDPDGAYAKRVTQLLMSLLA